MNKYEFKLTPAYCLYNGAVVLEQKGAYIKFMLEKPGCEEIKQSLTKAFSSFITYAIKNDDCPMEFRSLVRVDFEEGTRKEIRRYVSRLYESGSGGEGFDLELKTEQEIENRKKEAAAVLLLDNILLDARNKQATDIHIEKNGVKFRINGRLEKQFNLQRNRAMELIRRIKLLSGMNIMETRKSQDGNFVYGKENPLFVRVSAVNVIGSNYDNEESVVLRLLDVKRIPLSVAEIGFSEGQRQSIRNLLLEKNGLILISGPTGAGKSTTAAAFLLEIEKEYNGQLKIISLEDPPEYVIPGVTQIKVDENRKNTFDEILRHAFRQDPDVLMIGEIRDEKSAEAALRGALSGHLVIATIHTFSAGGAILRMENLGAGRKLLCSLLRGVIVQELNYFNERVRLVADVAVPEEEFESLGNDAWDEENLEKHFIHETNYAETIRNSVRMLKRTAAV